MKRKIHKTCLNCNHKFKPNNKNQKFCTMTCSNRYNGLKSRGLPKTGRPALEKEEVEMALPEEALAPVVEESSAPNPADTAYLSDESAALLKSIEMYLRYNDTDIKEAFHLVGLRQQYYDKTLAEIQKDLQQAKSASLGSQNPHSSVINALTRMEEDIKTQNSLILKIAERLFFLESELGVKPGAGSRP